jgi:hypothetical protein
MSEELTLPQAHLELLDHLGETVAVGIALPGNVPWAGCHGTLGHASAGIMETFRPEVAESLLRLKNHTGHFLVGDFSIPLDRHITSVRRTDAKLPYPGLDFIVGEDNPLTVRLTFVDHEDKKADD